MQHKPYSALGPDLEPTDCSVREIGDGGASEVQQEIEVKSDFCYEIGTKVLAATMKP
jgi:hypothetical protein